MLDILLSQEKQEKVETTSGKLKSSISPFFSWMKKVTVNSAHTYTLFLCEVRYGLWPYILSFFKKKYRMLKTDSLGGFIMALEQGVEARLCDG